MRTSGHLLGGHLGNTDRWLLCIRGCYGRTRTTRLYEAHALVVDPPGGRRRAAAAAKLADVVRAQLDQAEADRELRIASNIVDVVIAADAPVLTNCQDWPHRPGDTPPGGAGGGSGFQAAFTLGGTPLTHLNFGCWLNGCSGQAELWSSGTFRLRSHSQHACQCVRHILACLAGRWDGVSWLCMLCSGSGLARPRRKGGGPASRGATSLWTAARSETSPWLASHAPVAGARGGLLTGATPVTC